MSDNYVMMPNNVVQNIISNKTNKNSYVQLYGKRTVSYLKQLIELQNLREDIHFSIDMILWMSNIKNNIKRERIYFKDFLSALNKNSVIDFITSKNNPISLHASDFTIARLNIYDYKEDKDNNKYKVNYFMLLDSEYDIIINKYSGELDKYNLLNLFCNIKSRIKRNVDNVSPTERKPEVAYPSYDTIMKDIFIESDKSLKTYIDALVKLDLIRYDCAGDMIFKITGSQPIRRKSNFTYTLFLPQWEVELENAISIFKSRKIKNGWSFLTKDKEISANEKRSVTQKINMLEKISNDTTLTQTQKKELAKLKRQQGKWKKEYDDKVDIRKLEEEKLKAENPNKELSEIYEDMGFVRKADRANKDEEEFINWDDEVNDFNSIIETKGTGLHNKPLPLPKIYEEEPYIFEDSFDTDEEDYFSGINTFTKEKQRSLQEIGNLNHAQIPLDVLQMIENEREED